MCWRCAEGVDGLLHLSSKPKRRDQLKFDSRSYEYKHFLFTPVANALLIRYRDKFEKLELAAQFLFMNGVGGCGRIDEKKCVQLSEFF